MRAFGRTMRRPEIQVRCQKCGWVIEGKDTKTLNIEEDIQGADILTFKCKLCGTESKSRRYGR